MRQSNTSRRFSPLLTGIVLVMFVLSACGQASPPPTATPTKTPTAAATPQPPTDTPVPPTATQPPAALDTPTQAPAQATEKPTTAPVKPTATKAPAGGSDRGFTSPDYGVQAFLWWRPEIADRDLGLVQAAGFTWVKQNFPWREIEGAAKGKFDWSVTDRIVQQALEHNLKLIVRVDSQPKWAGGGFPCNGPPDNYKDFEDFLFAVANRYKWKIEAYQIWNEPNLNRPDGGGEWGCRPPNAAEYVRLLKSAYAGVKKGAPLALVISAGLTPTGSCCDVAIPDDKYLEQMYQAMGGSSTGYFDVLGVHAAGFHAAPNISPDEAAANKAAYGGERFFTFRRVEDLRKIMVKYGDTNKKVAVLEFGWSTDSRPDSPYHWHAVTEEQQGDYLVQAFEWAKNHWQPWIGLMVVVYMPDVDWTEAQEQYWWSIMKPSQIDELHWRPAYAKLRIYIRQQRGLAPNWPP
jgi:hypothetical protein